MATHLNHKRHHHRLLLGVDPPAKNGTRAHGSNFGSENNFDTNMVIILAALLCALICVLGLNSIIRCALRCGRRLVETPDEAAARLASTGLKKQVLRRIPVAVYRTAEGASGAKECPICLAELADGDKVRVLPKCKHEFHVKCIDTWLASHSSCPTCRQSLLVESIEVVTDAVQPAGTSAHPPSEATAAGGDDIS